MRRGKEVVLDTLRAHGVRYVFGNPGTTELPLIDGLLDCPDLQYILALQEAVVLGAAQAYALLSGSVGVVNLHVAPGLGNALGMLYNAKQGRAPLLVTAGQQDTRMRLREPFLQDDLVTMARPLVKWSVQAERADELPQILQRAFQIACTPPRGPVFVALPMDVLDAQTDAEPPLPPPQKNVPQADGQALATLAQALYQAEQVAIVCADDVAGADAVQSFVALAETLAAPVWHELLTPRVNFPTAHGLMQGALQGDRRAMFEQLQDADALLLVGEVRFQEIWYADHPLFADAEAVFQLVENETQATANLSARQVVVGDLAHSLVRLREQLDAQHATANDRTHWQERHAERMTRWHERKQKSREQHQQRVLSTTESGLPSSAAVMQTLADALPSEALIVHEAITAMPDLRRSFAFADAQAALGPLGGGIGQALPGGVGAQLAHPERQVVVISGDGSALYTVQALWTAAYHGLPILTVILSNRSYRILKLNLDRYRRTADIALDRGYPFLDLDTPPLDFVRLAEGFGAGARRVAQISELAPAIEEGLRRVQAEKRPWLIEVLLDG